MFLPADGGNMEGIEMRTIKEVMKITLGIVIAIVMMLITGYGV